MNIAFCLFKYFPYGGLQRDFIRIARTMRERGHEVHVYAMNWEGELEPGLHIHILPKIGMQNHVQNASFAASLHAVLQKRQHDAVVGFNKMPWLDLYYAADVCFQSCLRKKSGWLYQLLQLLPRYRSLISLENAIFARGQGTQIALIAKEQQKEFIQYYQTEENRFHFMPPGISKDRIAPENAGHIRHMLRSHYHLAEEDSLLLMIGSGFKTKGLDRAIRGLACLPDSLRETTQLFVIGEDKKAAFQKLALSLNVEKKVHFLGGRHDVPDFLLAADLLVHPARHENTGTVLLEALVSGLPVLTVDVCGYAHYIDEANAGMVLPSPFNQAIYNDSLQKMLLSPERDEWKQNGIAFAKQADIYHLQDRMAELIESMVEKRGEQRVPG